MKKKNFKHNCNICIFLGELLFTDNFTVGVDPDIVRAADLYVCSHDGGIPTVIARFGDEENDYISGLELHDNYRYTHLALKEAQLRAFESHILEVKFNPDNAKRYEPDN